MHPLRIPQLSERASASLQKMIENHPSIITTDWDGKLCTIRVFTSRTTQQLKDLFSNTDDHIKFTSKFISNENILKYKTTPQYLVTDPVYKVKKDLISVVDKDKGQLLVDFFEANRDKILEVVNSNPVESVRLFEFLEKAN